MNLGVTGSTYVRDMHQSDNASGTRFGLGDDATSHDTAAQLRVIRKLLSRAESTDFEPERDACLAKVAELMARHSIEEAFVWARRDDAGRETPIERIIEIPHPYAARKSILYDAVGRHNGCSVINLGAYGGEVQRVAVIGFRGDVDRVEVLVTSLLLQLTREMLAGGPANRGSSGSATAAWRRSFITAFAWRVSERLAAARRDRESEKARQASATGSGDSQPREPGPSLALVLADRNDAVQDEVRRRYPRLRTTRINAGSSQHGYNAGVAAADRATLQDPVSSGRRQALRA